VALYDRKYAGVAFFTWGEKTACVLKIFKRFQWQQKHKNRNSILANMNTGENNWIMSSYESKMLVFLIYSKLYFHIDEGKKMFWLTGRYSIEQSNIKNNSHKTLS